MFSVALRISRNLDWKLGNGSQGLDAVIFPGHELHQLFAFGDHLTSNATLTQAVAEFARSIATCAARFSRSFVTATVLRASWKICPYRSPSSFWASADSSGLKSYSRY